MASVGTVTGSLRINLVMRRPALLGFKVWLADHLCLLAAWVLGGRLEVELDPELTTRFGNDEPTVTKL